MNRFIDVIKDALPQLEKINGKTANADAYQLMQNVCGWDKAKMIVKENEIINEAHRKKFKELLQKRMNRESVNRIIGGKEFYGLYMELSPHVLEPRDDTECLVSGIINEVENRFSKDAKLHFADLGAGSGAIVVALLSHLPNATAVAVDICRHALKIVEKNAARWDVGDRLTVVKGNWVQGLDGDKFDFVVSNPPYIKSGEIKNLEKEVLYDPLTALDGGADGLDSYRVLLGNVDKYMKKNGFFAFEMGYDQKKHLEEMAQVNEWDIVNVGKDMGGNWRIMIVDKTQN